MQNRPRAMLLADEITDLPAFNELQTRVRQYFSGNLTVEAVSQAQEAVDMILGSMLATFHDELRYQVLTPELEEAALTIYEEFSLLRVDIPLIVQACESQDEKAAAEHLGAARSSVQTVLQVLGELSRRERESPRLSEVPLTHEVLRVGQLVLEQALEAQLLEERLEQYRLFHERLADGLAVMQPLGAEVEVWEARQECLRQALSSQEQALKALEQSLSRGDPELLEAGLDQLSEAAEELVAIQRALAAAANQPTSRLCPRCARDNELTARHCGGCGAQLPMSDQRSTFQVAEQASWHPAPLLQQLLDMAQAFAHREVSQEELQAEVEGAQARLQTVQQRMKRLKEPAAETPADQRELFTKLRGEMLAGLELLARGLEELRQGHAQGAQPLAEGAERLLELLPRLQNYGDALG